MDITGDRNRSFIYDMALPRGRSCPAVERGLEAFPLLPHYIPPNETGENDQEALR